MNLYTIQLLVYLALFAPLVSAKTDNEKIQEYLVQTLDNSKYDKRIAPEGSSGPGSPVDVNVSMYILDISKVDDDYREFDAQFYFRQSWFDSRLQSSSRTQDFVLREVDKIWTPDLFFVNEKEGSLNKMIQPNIFCRISPSGKVLFSVRVTEKLSCSMNFRKYPHDSQRCKIRAESYGFTRKHIELRFADKMQVEANTNITADEFELLDLEQKVFYETLSSGNYSTLEVHFTLSRKFGHYARKLYVPMIILVLLSFLSLWIKAKDKFMRLALLLVILYLMVTIASDFEWHTPTTSYTKASDVWIGFCEAMVFAAFLEFIAACIVGTESEENSKRKGEILASLDPEAKDNLSTDSLKSPMNRFMTMFEARTGGKAGMDMSYRVDRISRFLFPAVFILFNIVYWSVYCSP